MSDKSKSKQISRRDFGGLMVALGAAAPALVAQQNPQQNTQANPQQQPTAAQIAEWRRRRLVPDTPPFEAPLSSLEKMWPRGPSPSR